MSEERIFRQEANDVIHTTEDLEAARAARAQCDELLGGSPEELHGDRGLSTAASGEDDEHVKLVQARLRRAHAANAREPMPSAPDGDVSAEDARTAMEKRKRDASKTPTRRDRNKGINRGQNR